MPKYDIVKNWRETLIFMKTNPIVIMPFLYIGFLEGMALLIAWFSTRFPFSYIAVPIISKIYGEDAVHYPGIMYVLPDLFYFGQVIVWALFAVFFSAVTARMYKNLIDGRPVNVGEQIKETLPNYFSFPILAIVIGTLFSLMGVVSMTVLRKFLGPVPAIFIYYVFKFVLLTTVISSVPFIVFYKMNLFNAVKNSFIVWAKNFLTLFTIVFVPFLLYFPVFFAKYFYAEKYMAGMPEINLFLAMIGIVVIMLLGCFIYLCVMRFLLDRAQATEGKVT